MLKFISFFKDQGNHLKKYISKITHKKLKQLFLYNTFFSGESAVGKSSLVLRFVKGQFHEFQADPHI